MSTYVRQSATPIRNDDLIDLMAAASDKRGGGKGVGEFLAAHAHLETAGNPYNYNVGNVRGTSPEGLQTSITGATEYGEDGKLHEVPGGFRAYSSFERGADDMVSQIVRNYPDAWNARNISDYVTGLWHGRIGSYFGVPPLDPYGPGGKAARDRYERVLQQRYDLLFPGGGEATTPLPKAKGGATPSPSYSPGSARSPHHVFSKDDAEGD